jgi:hypothetical protein
LVAINPAPLSQRTFYLLRVDLQSWKDIAVLDKALSDSSIMGYKKLDWPQACPEVCGENFPTTKVSFGILASGALESGRGQIVSASARQLKELVKHAKMMRSHYAEGDF